MPEELADICVPYLASVWHTAGYVEAQPEAEQACAIGPHFDFSINTGRYLALAALYVGARTRPTQIALVLKNRLSRSRSGGQFAKSAA